MKLRGEKLTPRATAAGRVEWLRDRFEEDQELAIEFQQGGLKVSGRVRARLSQTGPKPTRKCRTPVQERSRSHVASKILEEGVRTTPSPSPLPMDPGTPPFGFSIIKRSVGRKACRRSNYVSYAKK